MIEIINTFLHSSLGNQILFFILVSCILLLTFMALRLPRSFFPPVAGTGNQQADSKSKNSDTGNSGECDDAPLAATMQTATILFIDLRDFNRLASDRTPEEISEILNRFFELIGSAVIAQGGWIDNYMGDGMLVAFNNRETPDKAAGKALKAVGTIRAAVTKLNRDISKTVKQPLHIGIGIHHGSVLIANLGHRNSMAKRIVGPAVKIAYKLEELSKEKNVQIIMTAETANAAKVPMDTLTTEYVVLRDDRIPVEVLCFTARQKIPRGRI